MMTTKVATMRTMIKPSADVSPSGPENSDLPSRISWVLEDLLTNDGHRLNVRFTCTIATADGPAEQKLLREVFKSRHQASPAAINSHFLPALRSAASELCQGETTHALLSPGARPGWVKTLQIAANAVAFMCGLEVLAPFEVEVTSPTMQRERLEQMQRIAAERRSADRVGHLARAAELLKQWESLKAAVPSITPGKLLEQVNPADRGLMLDTLLMAGASGASGVAQADLWAVSGQYLVRLDVKSDSPQTQLIPLPTTAGPLRSVRADHGKLLIGARCGVLMVDHEAPEKAEVFCHSSLSSEHGFTFATQIGNHLWACHREGGLCGWSVGDTSKPAVAIEPSQLGGDPKNLTTQGLFSVGSKLFKLLADRAPELVTDCQSPIVAVLPLENQILLVAEKGDIHLFDGPTLENAGEIQTAGRLTGAALLPWLSASRLLLSRADGPIECIGLEDQLVTQFAAGHTGMKAVTGCVGKVAAMSSDRQRILLWNAWDGRKTAVEIYIAGITRHRIADVVFG
jgi:hypothetical protein